MKRVMAIGRVTGRKRRRWTSTTTYEDLRGVIIQTERCQYGCVNRPCTTSRLVAVNHTDIRREEVS